MANTRLATQLFNSRRPWSYGIIIIIFLAFLQLWSITTSRVDTVEYLAPPRPPTEKPGQKDEVLLSPRCKEVRQILENIRNKVKPSSNEQLAHKDGTVKTDDGNWWWVNRQPRPGCWTYEVSF